jgi:hypothetical protein
MAGQINPINNQPGNSLVGPVKATLVPKAKTLNYAYHQAAGFSENVTGSIYVMWRTRQVSGDDQANSKPHLALNSTVNYIDV